jgi:hypothetical protein
MIENLNITENIKPAQKLFDLIYLIGLFIVACSYTLKTIYIYPDSYITVQTVFLIIAPPLLAAMFFRFLISGAVNLNPQTVAVFGLSMALIYYYGFFEGASDPRVVMAVLAVGGVGLPVRNIIKTVFAAEVIGVIITPTAFFLGQTSMQFVKYFRLDEQRFTFGYSHPNQLALRLFMVIVLFFYLYFDKLNIFHFLTAEALGIIMFILTDSRAGLLFITFAVLAFGIYKLLLTKKQFDILDKKFARIIAICAYPIFTAVSFLFIPLSKIKVLDNLSSGRMKFSAAAVSDFGISFISKIGEADNSYILDNFYIYTGVLEGLLFLIIYMVLFVLLTKRVIKVNRPLVILICLLACYMVFENIMRWGCLVPIAPLMLSGAAALTYERKPIAKTD